ncbi:hypothetical protein GCM10027422_06700 [Hymenobacter arcticus]
MLKLRNPEKLVVQRFGAKNVILTPTEVSTFRIENEKYTVVEGFEVRADFGRRIIMGKVFLQQLDSGRIELMRYDYPNNPNGTLPAPSIYLLRMGSTLAAISGKWTGNPGEEFRTNLLPIVASRPDLVQFVKSKYISANDMPDIVHALNTGKSLRAIETPGPKAD